MNAAGLNGRSIAGALLQHVPSALPARRTFGNTRAAFLQVIEAFHGTDHPVLDAYIQGFGAATNILFKHSRSDLGCSKL